MLTTMTKSRHGRPPSRPDLGYSGTLPQEEDGFMEDGLVILVDFSVLNLSFHHAAELEQGLITILALSTSWQGARHPSRDTYRNNIRYCGEVTRY